jgi:hypothetical protein
MLPKIEHPTVFIERPSTNEQLPFRRYLVKEEKILLFAKESKDINEIFKAIKDVVNNCYLDNEKDNCNNWSMYDLEYVFLMLRSHSVNNVEDFKITDREDGLDYTLFVEFDKIKLNFIQNPPSKNIKVNDNITIVMRYPKASIYDDNIIERITKDGLFPLIVHCVDSIFNNDERIDITHAELNEFMDNLDIKTFEKIKEFLFSTPSLKYTVSYTNSLGHEKEITFNSLMDFFLYL